MALSRILDIKTVQYRIDSKSQNDPFMLRFKGVENIHLNYYGEYDLIKYR